MELADALLAAPDADSARSLARSASADALGPAVEAIAARVLEALRVEPRRALEIAELATLAAESSPDSLHRARAEWVRGHALAGLLRNGEALQCYEGAAREYARQGRRGDVARVGIGRVNALTYLGRYREALRVGEEARAVLLGTGQAAAAARMDLNVGNLYHRIEKPRRAMLHYDRALRAVRAAGDASMTRVIRLNRATALCALGRLDEAERLYGEIAEETAKAGETRILAFVEFNLGFIRFQRGAYGPAYDTLDSARRAFESLGDEHFLALTLVDLAELLLEVNAFRRASAFAERAAELAAKLGLRYELGRATLFDAIARLGEGDDDGARTRLERAAEIFREEGHEPSEALASTHLAELDARRGDRDSADARLRRAANVFRREHMPFHEANALVRRGANDRARRRLRGARAHLAAARRVARRARSPWLDAQALHESGRVAAADGDTATAKRLYRRAIASVEAIRGSIGIDEFRVSFAQDKAPIYADLVELVLQSGGEAGLDEAFAVAERARSRALCDLLAGRLTPEIAADPQAARLLARLEKLRSELHRLGGASSGSAEGKRSLFRVGAKVGLVREREAEMTETLRRLERRSAHLGALSAGETISLDEARRDLAPGTTLVEYFLGPEGSWAFVVRREGARAVRLPESAAEIARRVAHLRFQIEKSCYGDNYAATRSASLARCVDRHLADLAASIWTPLDIPEGRVLLVPHGPLHSVPFAALPDGAGGHVVDRWTLTHLPSASSRRLLAGGAADREATGELAVLAVEAGDSSIPEVSREVDEVRRAFRRGKTLRRRASTRGAFRKAASDADVIHIATHGVFRADDPSFSSLQMADGWMGLHDIFALRLKARLVCLSACQSGRSWIGPGDELVGLSRGFLHAGASALLVSLWPVNDRSTAELMIRFYRGLRQGGSPDERLREAMRSLREERPEPFHWASFVLIGRGEAFPEKPARRGAGRGSPLQRDARFRKLRDHQTSDSRKRSHR